MTTRDIRARLQAMCGVEAFANLISQVTDGVLEELAEWRRSSRLGVRAIRGLVDRARVRVVDGRRRCQGGHDALSLS
jgi:transposase-like protein